MIDWKNHPDTRIQPGIDGEDAIQYASQQAGAYLERLNKFDVRTLTKEEWRGFIGEVIGSGVAMMEGKLKSRIEAYLAELDKIPF